jgi:cytochrome c556
VIPFRDLRPSAIARIAAAITATFVAMSVVAAPSDPIRERNELMRALGKEGFNVLSSMEKGRTDFDKASVEVSLDRMSEILKQLPPLWPANSKPKPPLPRYSSSLKIWDNKPDFDAKLAKLAAVIEESRGKVTDLESLHRTFSVIKQACDECHEVYQVTNRR